MRIGMELFCESQQHNTFTNRRVCISARGAIGNSVGDVPRFGLLSQVQLAEVVKLPAFQAAWSVHKGLIVGCRDCEFRHACVDPRLPVARGDGTYEHRSACHYDPQQGHWRSTGAHTADTSSIVPT